MSHNGFGMILPCMWCGSLNGHTLGCQAPKEINTRYSDSSLPIPCHRDGKVCEEHLKERASLSRAHPEYQMQMWDTYEWADDEITSLRAQLSASHISLGDSEIERKNLAAQLTSAKESEAYYKRQAIEYRDKCIVANEEIGRLKGEVRESQKHLDCAREEYDKRRELHKKQLAAARKEGADEMRERAAQATDSQCGECSIVIRSIPTTKEGEAE